MGAGGSARDRTLRSRLLQFYRSPWLPCGLVLLGVVLRVQPYLHGPALWFDELQLAFNIIERGYAGLARGLNYGQAAPPGFLWAVKASTEMLGDGELPFRLVPALASILSVPLFAQVARRMLSREVLPLAVALFVFCGPLIERGGDLKQYSMDVALTLAATLAALHMAARPPSLTGHLLFGAGGALALWCSFAMFFVLPATWLALLAVHGSAAEGRSRALRGLILCGLIWSGSLLLEYLLLLRAIAEHSVLHGFWRDMGGFLPLPPRSYQGLRWFDRNFIGFFSVPGGLGTPGLAALLALLGVVDLGRKSRTVLLLLAGPALLALLASALRVYPFSDRVVLYLVPGAFLLAARGWMALLDVTSSRLPWMGCALALLLLCDPAATSLYRLRSPPYREEVRPLLRTLVERRAAGERVFIYKDAWPAWRYYADGAGSGQGPVTVGCSDRDDWRGLDAEVSALRGAGRTWLFFSHFLDWHNARKEEMVRVIMDRYGRRLESHAGNGAWLFFYDFGSPEGG